jgi:hypothetical protein
VSVIAPSIGILGHGDTGMKLPEYHCDWFRRGRRSRVISSVVGRAPLEFRLSKLLALKRLFRRQDLPPAKFCDVAPRFRCDSSRPP